MAPQSPILVLLQSRVSRVKETRMRRADRIGLAAILVVGALSMGQAQTPRGVLGFDATAAPAQLELESKFDKAIQSKNLKPWLERLAARPHHVGSPYDKANADFLAELFKSWGFDARIERFDVLFPTPRTRVLEMTAPTKYVARLSEPVLTEDPTSNQTSEQLPIYNAYSVNGDVTGPLVYVNYGVPADYDELARHGVSVKGAIVIARYGVVARHQAESGCRARRDRVSDLLRSTRRWVFPGRGLSTGSLAKRVGSAAGLGHGHAALSRRSADARGWRNA
jgi:hypothetical protein